MNPETGELFWRVDHGKRCKAGQPLGSRTVGGYVETQVLGYRTYCHRLVFLLTHGEWPADKIDHRDSDKWNNAPRNLRACDATRNLCNAKTRSDNTSGVKGVSYNRVRGKWEAYVDIHRRRVWRRYFDSLEDAAVAVHTARQRLHGEFARNA